MQNTRVAKEVKQGLRSPRGYVIIKRSIRRVSFLSVTVSLKWNYFPNEHLLLLFSPSLTVCSTFATVHLSRSVSQIPPPHASSLLTFSLPSHINTQTHTGLLAERQADSCCRANGRNRARGNYSAASLWGFEPKYGQHPVPERQMNR